MNHLRESKFLKFICVLMAFSIFTMSCDPYGDNLVNKSIDRQADEFMNTYSNFMSEEECANFKESVDAVKGFVWAQRANGNNPSKGQIAGFIYDRAVRTGEIEKPSSLDRKKFVQFANDNTWSGDQTAIINKLLEENYFSSDVGNFLFEFKGNFERVNSYEEAYAVINDARLSRTFQSLTSQEQQVIAEALDGAEKTVCYEETSDRRENQKVWCEECSWTLHWVELVISIIVTVVAWIFAVVTLGLSTLLTSVVLVTVWTATWTLVCILVWCGDTQPCPDGQTAVCEGSFTFDSSIPACTNSSFPSNAFQFGDCIMSPRPTGGPCPPGSMPLGTNCLWECLSETPVQNGDGDWQIGFTCM